MIKIGDKVLIRPAYSKAFGGEQGILVGVIPESDLPLQVKFDDSNLIYAFSEEEVKQL